MQMAIWVWTINKKIWCLFVKKENNIKKTEGKSLNPHWTDTGFQDEGGESSESKVRATDTRD